MLLKDLIENPKLLDQFEKDGKRESYMQRQERAEDEYYAALGNEIEKHPITNVRHVPTPVLLGYPKRTCKTNT